MSDPAGMLIIDFETRSRCDLKARGSYLYATDPSTQVLCFFAGFDDTVVEGLTQGMLDYIAGGGLVAAHNAEFDMQIWEHCTDFPPVPLEQWYCTSAQCRVNAIPASLDDAGRFLQGARKSFAGAKLIQQLSIPREDGTFNEDPKLMRSMRKYCKQDVRATIDVVNKSRRMTPREHADWINAVKVNQRGVFIDRDLARLAQQYAGAEARVINTMIREKMIPFIHDHPLIDEKKWLKLTTFNQIQSIKNFLLTFSPATEEYMTKPDGKLGLDKRIRESMLMANDAGTLALIPLSRFLIEKMHEGNLSSVSKFGNMLARSDEDGLVQGAFVYAGASQTLRFSSKGLQLHNFKRDVWSPDEAEVLKQRMFDNEQLEDVMQTLARLLRPAIIPEEGNMLVVGDWTGVEARALPWLARADERMAMIESGADMYQVTSDELSLGDRQAGKVVELSMGFLGGVGALNTMAANYGLHFTEDEGQGMVNKWRAANQWAVEFGNDLERTAQKACRAREWGQTHQAGNSRISYTFIPDLIGGTLVCTLPSGDTIQYPGARVDNGQLTAKKANWTPAAGEEEWPRVSLWRGLLAENVTQATCAALLRWAIDELIFNDTTPVAHVHDEIILDSAQPESDAALLQEIMEEGPAWAKGLPLEAKPQIMRRYGK